MNQLKSVIISLSVFLHAFISYHSLAATLTAPLNYQHFAHLPMISGAKISPDGKLVAAIHQGEPGPSVVISEFGSQALWRVAKLKQDSDNIKEVIWLNDKRLLITVTSIKQRSNKTWQVQTYFSVNTDGSNVTYLTLPNSLLNKVTGPSQFSVLSRLPFDDKHILVQFYDPQHRAQTVYKVNVYNSKFTKYVVNRIGVERWVSDSFGLVQLGIGPQQHQPELKQVWYREGKQSDWFVIYQQKPNDTVRFEPIGMFDNKLLVLSNRVSGRNALWQFDPKTKRFIKVLYQHPKSDIVDVVLNREGTEVIGVNYIDGGLATYYFSEEDRRIADSVGESFVGLHTRLIDWDSSRTKFIISVDNDDTPKKFYFLDLSAGTAKGWYSQYPYLEGRKLNRKKPFNVQTEDGKALTAYLTKPDNQLNKELPPPLLVIPQKNVDNARIHRLFDYVVQSAANMGIAVLQVDSSIADNPEFSLSKMGTTNFIQTVHQDIQQAIAWLKKNERINTDKICMLGLGFSGYLSLRAAIEPDQALDCVVAISSMTDLPKWIQQQSAQVGLSQRGAEGALTESAIESIKKEPTLIAQLNKITAPILLIHGNHDTQVEVSHASDFYKKAKAAGKEIEYLELELGSHQLNENSNRLEAFKAIEVFLTKHLKL